MADLAKFESSEIGSTPSSGMPSPRSHLTAAGGKQAPARIVLSVWDDRGIIDSHIIPRGMCVSNPESSVECISIRLSAAEMLWFLDEQYGGDGFVDLAGLELRVTIQPSVRPTT